MKRQSPTLSALAGPWISSTLISSAMLLCSATALQAATVPTPAASPTAAPLSAAQEQTPDARAILQKMAHTLADAPGFSVTIHSAYDAIQADGQRIEFAEKREVQLQRPSYLRINTTRSDGELGEVLFDGKTVTVFKPQANVFARAEKPGTVDNAVLYLVKDLQIKVPLARMLLTTLPEEMETKIVSLAYVETNALSAVPTDHLAARLEDVDVQLWISQGERALPQRVVITYKNEPGQPQFRADLSNWQIATTVKPEVFSWTPPQGAEQVPLLAPVQGEALHIEAPEQKIETPDQAKQTGGVQ